MVPWANGLGTTAVIARVPDTDAWAWRLSIADVVTDGPFSALPGVDRWIAVARGAGMVLTVDGRDTTLIPSSGEFAFDGGAVTTCRLLDGPVQDLNLMLRRSRVTGSMEVVTVVAPLRVDGIAAVVVLSGTIMLDGSELAIHDAVLDPVGIATPVSTGDTVCLAVVRLTPR
ncbi:MAG: HutD family protein [Ilumatobacteraceae bacterium]